MAANRPITEAERQRIRELHAQNLSRNEIARQIKRSGRAVSEIAKELGLEFTRTRTAAATEARKQDAKARRAALALALLDDAHRLRQQLWQPAKVFNFGGRDNTYNEVTLDEPTYADKAKIMQSVGIAVDRSVKLDQYDADPGIDTAKSMLGALAKGLGEAYEQLTRTDDPATDGD